MKIAVVTDTGSGLLQQEARDAGIRVVPFSFIIDDKVYKQEQDLTEEEFFERLAAGTNVSTSQPSPGDLSEAWDEALQEADAVIHIPLTSGLSGAAQTARMMAEDDEYEGKVFVCDNRGVSVTQVFACREALRLAAEGFSPEEICSRLMNGEERNGIYIAIDKLDYLKHGGRVTPAVAAIGTILHIKPVLAIHHGEKLDTYKLERSSARCLQIITDAIKTELTEKYGDPECQHAVLQVAHANNMAGAEKLAALLDSTFPNRKEKEIRIIRLSRVISCHTGPGAVGSGFSCDI